MHDVRTGSKRGRKGIKAKENRTSRVRLQALTLSDSTPMHFPLHTFCHHKPDPQTITQSVSFVAHNSNKLGHPVSESIAD